MAGIQVADAVAGGAGIAARGDTVGLLPAFEISADIVFVFAEWVTRHQAGLRDEGAVHERAAVVACNTLAAGGDCRWIPNTARGGLGGRRDTATVDTGGGA